MSRSIRSLLGFAATFSALFPVLASAQSATPIATADQVRAQFISAGYQVDAPTTWWTNGSTTFLVHDPLGQSDSNARIVMVLVYPDLETAHAERQRTDAAPSGAGMPGSDFGPRLVPGYGPSVWQGNVAMVEATFGELNRQYQAQLETDLGTAIAVGRSQTTEPAQRPQIVATTQVDADFVAVLNEGGAAANF
jgi:hypothetical protein